MKLRAKIPEHPPEDSSMSAYLPSGSTVVGNLVFQNPSRINGKVEGGDIIAMNQLAVGESGEVAGTIEAPEVLLAGKLIGDISTNRIDLAPTATVVGNLSVAV